MKGWVREKEVKAFVNNFLARSLGPQKDRAEIIFWFEKLIEKENLQIQLLTKEEVPDLALPGVWEGMEVQRNVDLTRRKYL